MQSVELSNEELEILLEALSCLHNESFNSIESEALMARLMALQPQ